ncbi:MAG: hypothetical protein AB7I25_09160 [Vicinamibacterales bacterium]
MSTRFPLVASLLLAALAAAVPASAQFPRVAPPVRDYRVEFAYNTWKPQPELTLRAGAGDDVDLVGAFGLEKPNVRQFSLTVKPGMHHKLRFQYVPMTFDKDATLNQTFTWAGSTYSVNVPATLNLDWVLSRAGYEWDPISTPSGYLGLIAEVKYNQIRANVTAEGVGRTSLRTNAPIPAVGVAGGGYLLPRTLSVHFEVTGFQLPDRVDLEGRFIDYDVRITGHLGRALGVQAGYRSIDARYLVDTDRGTLKMKGPYIGAALRF